MNKPEDYKNACAQGRAEATHDIAAVRETGNMPLFVRKIREAAADESGFGTGYLFVLAGKAVQ